MRASRAVRGFALVAGVILLAVVLVLTLARHRHGHRAVTTAFGANVNRLFNDPGVSGHTIAAQLSELEATGATIARSDALWEAAEPTPPHDGRHSYVWAFDDRIARALAEHHLRWLPIIDYSPVWARSVIGVDHSAPSSFAAYASYARALAQRYGPGGMFWLQHPRLAARPVHLWEIWNEPDNPAFWRPRPAPGRYALLYARARDAITSVDPSARVIIGGLTDPGPFLTAMLAGRTGFRGPVDGVAIHPYARDPAAVLARVRSARHALDSLGLVSIPLYVTEFGWAVHPRDAPVYASDRLRAAYIAQTLVSLTRRRCGVAAVVLYTWMTPMRRVSDREDWFGISPPSGGVTDAMRAFTGGIALADRRQFRAARVSEEC